MHWASLIYPVNFSQSITTPPIEPYSPVGFHVAAARNQCVAAALQKGFEWLFFLDHDVIPPPDLFIRLGAYMQSREYPIIAGVYFHKGDPSYPLLFRGRGNGVFLDWQRGDSVWVDGIPMGCTLIHTSIFKHLPQLPLTDGTGGRGWFDTPRWASYDPEKYEYRREVGTEDLHFCTRVIEQGVVAKAGWPQVAEREFPFLVDTRLWCQHIDEDGRLFPDRDLAVGECATTILESARGAA